MLFFVENSSVYFIFSLNDQLSDSVWALYNKYLGIYSRDFGQFWALSAKMVTGILYTCQIFCKHNQLTISQNNILMFWLFCSFSDCGGIYTSWNKTKYFITTSYVELWYLDILHQEFLVCTPDRTV